MAQFNKKNKYNFWHSPPALIALFCLFLLFAYNMIGLVKKERETNRNKISELKKIEELRKRQDILSRDLDKLNTSDGIEESVRDKFQVVKPGEKMVTIVEDEQKNPEPVNEITDHSFWGYIKRLFSR